jgi:Zn-dependent protease with chaperone function
MATPKRDRDPPPALDPFAFPSDTTSRFLLLVVAVAGTALFAFHSLAVNARAGEIKRFSACLAAAGAGGDRCGGARLHHAVAATMLAAFGLLLVIAFVLYLVMPVWRLRRRRLVPLTAEDVPEVAGRLAELSREAGLETPPRFVWNALDRSASGLAFGRAGRRYVALGGGLVVKHYTDPPAFRAIVLHELGHLRNRDVDMTYLTMALWYSLLGVAVVPLLVSLHDDRGAYIWSIVWRLGVLVAFVYLSRNAVLRARESYADLRAVRSDADADALRRVIGGLRATGSARWRRLLSLHPEPHARMALLGDTQPLFQPGLGEAFTAGVVLTLVYAQLVLLVAYLDAYLVYEYLVAALIVVPACAGVVTLAIWRGAFLRLAHPDATTRAPRVGIALGVGFLAGELVSLLTIQTSGDRPLAAATHLPRIPAVVSTDIRAASLVWVGIALLSLALFVIWVDACAAIWLSRGGERLPRVAVIGGVAVASAVLSVWLALFFFLHDIAVPAAQADTPHFDVAAAPVARAIELGPPIVFRYVWDGEGLVVGAYWFVIPAFALIWAFPLAAAVIRRRTATLPTWAFLRTPRPPTVHAAVLQPTRATIVGLAAGLAASVGMLVLRATLHATHRIESLSGDFFVGLYHWEYVLAIGAQVLAAAIAVLLCRNSAVLHGLLAAFVAGIVAVIGLELTLPIRSCISTFNLGVHHACPTFADAATTHDDFNVVLAHGAPLALITSLAVYSLRGLFRRERPGHEPLEPVRTRPTPPAATHRSG